MREKESEVSRVTVGVGAHHDRSQEMTGNLKPEWQGATEIQRHVPKRETEAVRQQGSNPGPADPTSPSRAGSQAGNRVTCSS